MSVYNMTAYGIRRLNLSIEAESREKACELMAEIYMSREDKLPRLVDVYDGNVMYFDAPVTHEHRERQVYGVESEFNGFERKCGNCHKEIEGEFRYCPWCGSKVKG